MEDVKKVGLYPRYKVIKTEGEVDPKALYFVLRYDADGKDKTHIAACLAALEMYSLMIENHLPLLAADIAAEVKRERTRLIEKHGDDLFP